MKDTSNLVARLRELRQLLKMGEYNGNDVMTAWMRCAEAADEIERLYDSLASAVMRANSAEIDVKRLRAALQNIVDGYGGGSYETWDFVGIARNALGLARPAVHDIDSDIAAIEGHRLEIMQLASRNGLDAREYIVDYEAAPSDETTGPRYSCFVAGCPGNHPSKWMVCETKGA